MSITRTKHTGEALERIVCRSWLVVDWQMLFFFWWMSCSINSAIVVFLHCFISRDQSRKRKKHTLHNHICIIVFIPSVHWMFLTSAFIGFWCSKTQSKWIAWTDWNRLECLKQTHLIHLMQLTLWSSYSLFHTEAVFIILLFNDPQASSHRVVPPDRLVARLF